MLISSAPTQSVAAAEWQMHAIWKIATVLTDQSSSSVMHIFDGQPLYVRCNDMKADSCLGESSKYSFSTAMTAWQPLCSSSYSAFEAMDQKLYRVVFVVDVPPHEMLLDQQFLQHCVVDGVDGGLELLVKLLLSVRDGGRAPVYRRTETFINAVDIAAEYIQVSQAIAGSFLAPYPSRPNKFGQIFVSMRPV